ARAVSRSGGEHALPFSQASGVVGRGIEVDDQFGAAVGLFGDGPGRAPRVLADADADPDAGDAEEGQLPGSGGEVALPVEDGDVAARLLGSLQALQDPAQVSLEVADDGVDLTGGDAHSRHEIRLRETASVLDELIERSASPAWAGVAVQRLRDGDGGRATRLAED